MKHAMPFLLLSLLTSSGLQAGQGKAWAWVDQPQLPSSTPSLAYQYNSFGGAVTVQRLSAGQWNVTIPGMTGTGVAHISEYGGSHYCGVSVFPGFLRVFCEAVDDNFDGRFTVFYYEENTSTRTGGYLYAPILSNEQQCSTPTAVWNSSNGASTLTCGTLDSVVRFHGLTVTASGPSVAFGSRAGHNPTCGVVNWGFATWIFGSTFVRVSCNGEGGASFGPTSMSASLLNSVRFGGLNHHGAYLHANQKDAAQGVPYSPANRFITSGGGLTVTRVGTGRYRAFLPQLAWSGSTTAIVQAVRGSNENAYCSLVSWTGNTFGTTVTIQCHASRRLLPSVPVNANFNLLYLTDDPILSR